MTIEETAYGLRTSVPLDYDEAVARVGEALKAEGFGILTSIDVRATLKEKLNLEFRRYVILGACNPHLASRALAAEIDIGLLLPCNVIVYEADECCSVVAAMAPRAALALAGGNPAVTAVAEEADARLRRALDAVATART